MTDRPILLDLHVPVTTARLVMRPPQAPDAKAYNEAMQESFNELHQWMPWAQTRESLKESEEFLGATWLHDWPSQESWLSKKRLP